MVPCVVSYRNSTSNHNCDGRGRRWMQLYLIEILHQTTTERENRWNNPCCILSKFYIKPQPLVWEAPSRNVVSYRNSTSNHNSVRHSSANSSLYLIEILHQTTTPGPWRVDGHMVVSYRNSTSNHNVCIRLSKCLWVVSYRNSTSNHNTRHCRVNANTVVSYRNSTSNHNRERIDNVVVGVVSYRNSTSNHNSASAIKLGTRVVSYRNSTSNHNSSAVFLILLMLYLIEILHQTTTDWMLEDSEQCCILSKFYIKPQLSILLTLVIVCCILSKFYIKPQLLLFASLCELVVSYRNSTSNHNIASQVDEMLYVVSYRNSTSNHNSTCAIIAGDKLYLIEILHQTTTFSQKHISIEKLYLIEILHQTTTR